MGRLFAVHLEGKIYSCKHCRTHLALYEDIVSKAFHSRHGKAYLFSKVGDREMGDIAIFKLQDPEYANLCDRVNVSVGEKEDRMMMTGLHTVADIFCVGCGSIVGWKYEHAREKNQKYKEGKSVLERFKMCGPDGSNYWVNHEPRVASDADDV